MDNEDNQFILLAATIVITILTLIDCEDDVYDSHLDNLNLALALEHHELELKPGHGYRYFDLDYLLGIRVLLDLMTL